MMSDPKQKRSAQLRGRASIAIQGMQVSRNIHGRIAASPHAFYC